MSGKNKIEFLDKSLNGSFGEAF